MRTVLGVVCGVLLAALVVVGAPVLGQQADNAGPYELKLLGVTPHTESRNGVSVRQLVVRFSVTPREGVKADDGQSYEVVIYEYGKEVARVPLTAGRAEDLSAILALDISGSMAEGNRIEQAREATRIFFQKLPEKADTGLILFNHKMVKQDPLTHNRQLLIEDILHAVPSGGTAYLDATVKGVEMLAGVQRGAKAIVIMTDGVDLNSETSLGTAIKTAKAAGVKVYTVGIGEPGKQQKMTSVLVLDHSGSMQEPANDQDRASKIDALKEAGKLFMSFVREGLARTTVLAFSDVPDVPGNFTSDRTALKGKINELKPAGETALFDATYDAVQALVAERPEGKRAVVALTDGIDNSSRRRVEEVITAAKEAGIPLYTLGFGRKGELDEDVMKRMANETGGKYYHAESKQALMDIFEKLANSLHDDGINEADLKKLAWETGGDYFHARDVSKMQLILKQVVEVLQAKPYTKVFDDRVQVDDGRPREIRLELVRGGSQVVGGAGASVATHGLVIPEVNHFVYLGLLGVIGLLIALPAGLRRMSRSAG
jgi:VWFA-related protein